MRQYYLVSFMLAAFLLAAPAAAQQDPAQPPALAEIAPAPGSPLPPADVTAEAPATPAAAEPQAELTDEAQRVWEKYGDAIYQVQVIDLNTASKNSIGSSFQFTKDGLMGTNYHVVASAVQHPGKYKLEYVHDKGDKGVLKIVQVDVVNDLAILKMEKPGKTFIELGKSLQPKGSRLFSLGNPLDVGFTIIEGTYNGVNRDSFIDKIHFSGALNPGMSGGPAMSHDGKVIGINVATAGNSVSFLVPVEPLHELVKEQAALPENYDFAANASKHIEGQLLKAQDEIGRQLTAPEPWKSVSFGPFDVPGRVNPAFKCWGDTDRGEKQPYQEYSQSDCQTQDRLFIDNGFTTGTIGYSFRSLVASEKLNPSRFYSYYRGQYGSPGGFNYAREEDVGNYDCNSRFITLEEHRWKAAFCVRRYKKYPRLYDMDIYMALVDNLTRGMIVTLNAQGFSKDNALKVANRFFSEIKRKKGEPGANPAPPASTRATAKPEGVSAGKTEGGVK